MGDPAHDDRVRRGDLHVDLLRDAVDRLALHLVHGGRVDAIGVRADAPVVQTGLDAGILGRPERLLRAVVFGLGGWGTIAPVLVECCVEILPLLTGDARGRDLVRLDYVVEQARDLNQRWTKATRKAMSDEPAGLSGLVQFISGAGKRHYARVVSPCTFNVRRTRRKFLLATDSALSKVGTSHAEPGAFFF